MGLLMPKSKHPKKFYPQPQLCLSNSSFVTVRNEVGKVMFLQVSVCPRGGGSWSGGAWSGVCAWSWGVPDPGGCSRGCLFLGECLLGGGLVSQHALRQNPPPPRERWLLLRTVRILLECILVSASFSQK